MCFKSLHSPASFWSARTPIHMASTTTTTITEQTAENTAEQRKAEHYQPALPRMALEYANECTLNASRWLYNEDSYAFTLYALTAHQSSATNVFFRVNAEMHKFNEVTKSTYYYIFSFVFFLFEGIINTLVYCYVTYIMYIHLCLFLCFGFFSLFVVLALAVTALDGVGVFVVIVIEGGKKTNIHYNNNNNKFYVVLHFLFIHQFIIWGDGGGVTEMEKWTRNERTSDCTWAEWLSLNAESHRQRRQRQRPIQMAMVWWT